MISAGRRTIEFDPNYIIRLIDDENDIKRPQLRSLWSFWRSKAPAGLLPARSDFLIEEFLSWGRNISIMRREPETGRYRVTLASTAMIDLNGCNPTGLTPEEFVPPQSLEFSLNCLKHAERESKAALDTYIVNRNDQALGCDRLTLPCADDGETIDCVIVGHYFDRGFLGRLSDATVFDRIEEFRSGSRPDR
ncbi:MAG: hypothetical protein RJQ21_03985 [Rhodospirillales bacterium]